MGKRRPSLYEAFSGEHLLPAESLHEIAKTAGAAAVRAWQTWLRKQPPLAHLNLLLGVPDSYQRAGALIETALQAGGRRLVDMLCKSLAHRSGGLGEKQQTYVLQVSKLWVHRSLRKGLTRTLVADVLKGRDYPTFDYAVERVQRYLNSRASILLDGFSRQVQLAGAVYGATSKANLTSHTRKEIAQEFGVDVRTVDNWAAKKKITKTPRGRIAEDAALKKFRAEFHSAGP